jgi:type IV pilus assembly protein PilX
VNTPGCPPERPRIALRPRRARRGISLITSLMLLTLISLVVVSGMRSGVLQARMSGAAQDRNLAFQAAEAALREAERATAATPPASFPAAGCLTGNCSRPATADTPRWLDAAFAGWRNAAASAPAAAPQAQVFVEDMGTAPNWPGCDSEIPRQPNCLTPRYRITARSAAEGRASVVVQSQMAAP